MIEPDSNQIYLSDFAENPELMRELGKDSIIFGYSPMPGRSMRVSVDYVIGKFKRYLTGVSIIAPETDIILVYRKALQSINEEASGVTQNYYPDGIQEKNHSGLYDETQIKTMILAAFENKLEVSFDERLDMDYDQFPPTPLSGIIESINLYLRGSKKYMARIEYLEEDGSREYETAVFTVKWPVMGLKANKLIRKDVLLSEEYLYFEEIDYFDYKGPVLKSEMPNDYVANYNISEGKILEWGMLKKRSYVLKGQIISAIVQISGVTVTSKVEMIENAEIGQLASAKNVDSGIIITGIVDEGPVLRITY